MASKKHASLLTLGPKIKLLMRNNDTEPHLKFHDYIPTTYIQHDEVCSDIRFVIIVHLSQAMIAL